MSALATEALSESPDTHTESIETASQVEEEGPEATLEKRLDSMESRQKRIEDERKEQRRKYMEGVEARESYSHLVFSLELLIILSV